MKPSSYLTEPSPATDSLDAPICPGCKIEFPAGMVDRIERCCGRDVYIEVTEQGYSTRFILF